MNSVRVFEKEDGKKNSCHMKEEERYEIRTNKKTQLILQAADICEAYIISENKKVWN